jgi:hypothetical protein
MSPSTAITIDQVCPGPSGSAGGDRYAEAVISDFSEHTAEDSGDVELEFIRVAPRIHQRIPNFPLPQAPTKRRSFQETASWEGVVLQTNDEGVIAKLTRRYQDFPAEEAMIPWQEIDNSDRDIVSEGALFSWKVGYLESNGTRLSVSKIEFRKIPNFSTRERTAAQVKAQEYAALFND